MHRIRQYPDGTKALELYRGAGDPDDPASWIIAEVDARGEPYLYRVSDDVQLGVSHVGHVLLHIAGVTFGIPDEQLGDIEAMLELVRKDARQRRREYEAEVRRAAASS